MPRVSVIMSIYREPIEWMKQAVDSILNQTYSGFELIIVNDCPNRKENYRFLCEYKQKDSRISIISNDTNIGLTKSLNKALIKAKGEFIARMDADDISQPHRLETQVAYMDNHPDIAAVGSWIMHIDENGNNIEVIKYETSSRWIRALLIQNSQVCHPSAMFRKTIKDFIVKYDESIRYAQDYALWVSIIPYGEIANIPEVLFSYRTSEQQITSKKRAEQEAYAKIIQRRAFYVLGFHPSNSFLELFFGMTIQHNMDWNKDEGKREFSHFFKGQNKTTENSLALEIILSTYIVFLRNHNNGSFFKFAFDVINHFSADMFTLGVGLIKDVGLRKFHRINYFQNS